MTDILIKEYTFNHSIARVWKAITEASEIAQWFIHADFEAKQGYEYTFTATEEHGGTKIRGQVLEANPYTLKYTWRVGDNPVETIVAWHLESVGTRTKLTLEHSGISKYDDETAIEMFGHFGIGWDACLAVLPKYLNDEATEPSH